MNDKYNILIVGVGGQGVLLASEIISSVAMDYGLDVKKSEVHGMSQRGGVVSSHIKVAPKVFSPTIAYGEADILIAFEQAEGLRALDWLKKDGTAIISTTTLIPAIVTSTREYTYPADAMGIIKKRCPHTISVSGDSIAAELGNPRLVNTILLGVLSNHLPFPRQLWTDFVTSKVKAKFVEINLEAFDRGRKLTGSTVGV